MDGLGEAVENVGLAQEIQKGLAKSMQVPPKFKEWQAEIDAKLTELQGQSLAQIKETRLGKNIINEIAKDAGGVEPSSLTDPQLAVLAKYTIASAKNKDVKVSQALFEEMRPLGKGAFGAVFLTFKKDTGCPYAVKKCVKAIAKQNHMIKDVLIEREVLAKIDSPFCVTLHYAYQTSDIILLVLTLCAGGDLSFLLHQQWNKGTFTKLGNEAVKFYGASMACGLEAIHKAGYVYRDLKPQNVLLDGDGLVRISDMGLTADVSKGAIKQCSGTRGYWSPETINKEAYTFEPDFWSLGVTMFVLFSDKMPFSGKSDEEKDAATLAGEIDFKHEEPEDLQKVIKDLCNKDIKARLGSDGGLTAIKAHPYFSGFNWDALEKGTLPPPVVPNPNDINAPGKDEIAKFVKPKDVEWTDQDQAAFATWDFFNYVLWEDECLFRIKKYKELSGGGGGGGCCTIA